MSPLDWLRPDPQSASSGQADPATADLGGLASSIARLPGGLGAQLAALSPENQPGYAEQASHLSPQQTVLGGDEATQLEEEIRTSSWAAIRQRLYAQYAQPIRERVQERKEGKREDMTGIGSQVAVSRFASRVKALQPRWAGLTPWWRAQKLYSAANEELQAIGVPAMLTVFLADIPSRGGFDKNTWCMLLQRELLSRPELDDDLAGEMGDIALHETRHCEQHFRVARLQAGRGMAAGEIAAAKGIPGHIAQVAAAKPLTPATGTKQEIDEAQVWEQSLGADYAKAKQIGANLGAAIGTLETLRTGADLAVKAHRLSPSPATQATVTAARTALLNQVKVVEEAYAAYRAIPHEQDAHEVGVTVDEAVADLS